MAKKLKTITKAVGYTAIFNNDEEVARFYDDGEMEKNCMKFMSDYPEKCTALFLVEVREMSFREFIENSRVKPKKGE